MGRKVPFRRALAMALRYATTVAACLLVLSCESLPSDQEIRGRFDAHRATCEEIVRLMQTQPRVRLVHGVGVVYDDESRTIEENSSDLRRLSVLVEQLQSSVFRPRANSGEALPSPTATQTPVFISLSTIGAVTHSEDKGVAHLPYKPNSVWGTLDSVDAGRDCNPCFAHLEGPWYLWVDRDVAASDFHSTP